MEENTEVRLTANDEFKQTSGKWMQIGVIVAVSLHVGLFLVVPQFEAADLSTTADELTAITLPPEVKIPPPPEKIARPATPRVASVDIPDDVTIAPTTFEMNPVENLPPPPSGGTPADRPSFIPYDTSPALLNRAEVTRLLQRYYPRNLKEAGIGGRVELWLYVNERGRVEKSEVKTSTGNALLDDAAMRVAAEMRFSPAKNRDKVTAVWVQQWVTFEVV